MNRRLIKFVYNQYKHKQLLYIYFVIYIKCVCLNAPYTHMNKINVFSKSAKTNDVQVNIYKKKQQLHYISKIPRYKSFEESTHKFIVKILMATIFILFYSYKGGDWFRSMFGQGWTSCGSKWWPNQHRTT